MTLSPSARVLCGGVGVCGVCFSAFFFCVVNPPGLGGTLLHRGSKINWGEVTSGSLVTCERNSLAHLRFWEALFEAFIANLASFSV